MTASNNEAVDAGCCFLIPREAFLLKGPVGLQDLVDESRLNTHVLLYAYATLPQNIDGLVVLDPNLSSALVSASA